MESSSGITHPPAHSLLALRTVSRSADMAVALPEEVLTAWVRRLHNRYLSSAPGADSSLRISGESVEIMATAVLHLLKHIHSCSKDDVTPPTPPTLLTGIHSISNVSLKAFLYDERTYRLVTPNGDDTHRGQSRTLTIGQGLERSIWSQLFTTMTADDLHWIQISDYYAPKLGVFRLRTPASHSLWLSYGAACALHIIHSGSAPEPVTPFLLLAIILGQDNFHTLTFEDISSFDIKLGKTLQPWLEVPVNGPFPDGPLSPVSQLLIQECNFQVRSFFAFYYLLEYDLMRLSSSETS